jgi:hypothetical protein
MLSRPPPSKWVEGGELSAPGGAGETFGVLGEAAALELLGVDGSGIADMSCRER